MTASLKDQTRIRPGAHIVDGGVHFCVWAPERREIGLVFVNSDRQEQREIQLERESGEFFGALVDGVEPGAFYYYRVDDDPQNYPDPASHFQPQGVFGPSQVIDHRRFAWSDDAWRGVKLPGQVLYELHLGLFTPEGTWRAAIEKLPHLRDLGITLIEVMPVAAFPGEFGWGYDGVFWYAPTQLYGTPDDFRMFVDRAHAIGLGIILDVVYNHFGPAGNFTGQFSPYYTSQKHRTDWGSAINFDDAHADPVREFVAESAAHWIREYHLDGLRLDAIHSVIDDSDEHIVTQLTRAARSAAGDRSIIVVSEDDKNRCQQVLSPEEGGWGNDGLFNDDFHHACRVAATGNTEAYYRDFTGSPQELISTIRFGHLYQGQWSTRQGHPRGVPTRNIPARHFIHFLQNHDQVANSANGLRTHLLTSPGRFRALTALLLLGPETPLLFMGQEFGASNPFLYFADHDPELAELVHHGRREFMHQFPRIKSLEPAAPLPHPAEEQTYLKCKLNWDECQPDSSMMVLHRDLLRLRREDAVFSRQNRMSMEGAVIGPEAFALRWCSNSEDDRLALFNLGRDFDWLPISDPLVAPPWGKQWNLIWSSESPQYGGTGTPNFDNKNWYVPGHTAVAFATCDR